MVVMLPTNEPRTRTMSTKEVLDLPAAIDILTACRILGIGRTTGYGLAKRGEFPCRVVPIGRQYRVPTAELLSLLGLSVTAVGDAWGAEHAA